MLDKNKKKQIYVIILVSLFLASLACRIEAPRIILSETATNTPVDVITQVVTEVITPTPQPIITQAPPTATPAPTLTPTWDPLSVPIYFPLADCVASRLHIGDRAMVSLLGGPNAIRSSADLRTDTNIIGYADPGAILLIEGGPHCDLNHIIWLVETMDGVRGFTPEGNGEQYWLFPVGP